MRKILSLSLLFICSSLLATAQIKKGAVLLGGQIAFSDAESESNNNQPNQQQTQKNNNAFFRISVGKAIKENTVAGINAGYGSNKNENFNNNTLVSSSDFKQYSVGVFYRQYKKIGGNFYFFGEGGADYIGSTQKDNNFPGNNLITRKGSGVQLSLTPGISYQVLKKLQLEILIPDIAALQYNTLKTTAQNSNSKQNQFSFNTSLSSSPFNSLGVGFRLVL
jgi:hypothetical protein